MITLWIILILIFVSFKGDITGFIDLYSTLDSNIKIYRINYIVIATFGTVETYFDFSILLALTQGRWEMPSFGPTFWKYFCVMSIVNVVGMIVSGELLKKKPLIQEWMRRKKISKSLKKTWENKREKKQTESDTQLPVQEVPKAEE